VVSQNILVVSDLHFGEELLPGASADRRHAVELGSTAFREFLRYHTARRRDGRPWRLVIAGDLFDFMSVVVASVPNRPTHGTRSTRSTRDERAFGLRRGALPGIERLRQICEAHRPMLADLARFAAAGHSIDIIAGNHDVELLLPDVAAELRRQIAATRPIDTKALERIRVVPWFVYVPGVAWIEHGHVYDEGCSFEFNLAPMDPKDGWLIHNADTAAVRYLGSAAPELDPHGTESWSFWGYLRYAMSHGQSRAAIWLGYARFVKSLFVARALHRSRKRRERRQREHHARLAQVAADNAMPLDQLRAIDRLARAPLTLSARRVARMLMLDRFGLGLGLAILAIALLVLLPIAWAIVGVLAGVGAAFAISRWLGAHLVTSQLPMRSVPARLRKLVDAPVIVFGHTHDPRWQRLHSGGIYANTGTWLPATRPGVRRSFTHVFISPGVRGGAPHCELRQWREGTSVPFDAAANVGAGVHTLPGVAVEI
jgi:UDP-2,3-diacylglucosamine pyrophosphatase LpxH